MNQEAPETRQLKIAYAAQVPIPSHRAYAVHVMHMCQAFAQLGHDVALYGMPPSIEVDDAHDYYGMPRSFNLASIPMSRLRGLAGPAFGRAIVRHALRNRPPDLFYSRHIYAAAFARRAGLPVIYEVHMPVSNAAHHWLLRGMLRDRQRFRLVAITDALRERYLEDFPELQHDDVLIAHDGAVLPENRSPTVTENPMSNGFRAGYVGNLFPGKGMELIVDIAARMPDVSFDIIGGRPEDVGYWRSQLRSDNVNLYGQVSHGALQPFFDRMDVALLPLQKQVSPDGGSGDISRWTSPMKMFEYMAQGRAIVSSDLCVLAEVLTDGCNAIIAPGDDPEAWVQAIRRLEVDHEFRFRLGKHAFRDLKRKYTWSARAKKILDAISDMDTKFVSAISQE